MRLNLLLETRILVLHDVLVLLGSSPLGRLGPLWILPGALVAQFTAAFALAGTTNVLGKVLSGDLCQQFLLVVGTKYMDLFDSHGVQEALDGVESAAETPRGVDQVELAQTLGVVVLRDARGLTNIPIHRRDTCDTDALQVHDGAAGLEQLACLPRAGGQSGVSKLLVLSDEVLQHALGGGDFVHGVKIDLAQFLDVDRSSILFPFYSQLASESAGTNTCMVAVPYPSCGSTEDRT